VEDFPQVMARKLNLKRAVSNRDRRRAAHRAKRHRLLLTVNPKDADAMVSDVIVIGREKLGDRL